METWVIYVATAVVILILGILIQERIADKKAKKSAQNKPAEECQPIAAVVSEATKQDTTNRTGTEILTDFLTQTGCVVEHSEVREEWTYRVFLCQGAYFESYTHNENDEVLLYYHWVIPYSKKNFAWVQRICHQLTAQNKYSKVFYRYDSKNDKFDIVIQTAAIAPSIDVLKLFVHITFEAARQLQLDFDNYNDGYEKTEEEIVEDARSKTLYHRCQQYNEPMRVLANYKYFNTNQLSIAQVITSLFDQENVEDMLSLTVISENGTDQITQRDRIAAFDLFSTLITKKENSLDVSTIPVAMTLDTTFNHYTFTLHLVEQTPENVFIRLSAMKVLYDHLQEQVPAYAYTPQSISCLLCYETSEEHSFEAFGKQMEAARVARRNGETLTDEQHELLKMGGGKAAYQMDEGIRLANHGCYVQAIELLEPVLQKYMNNDHTDMHIWTASRAAYHLGLCYYNLSIMNKAYYYLDFARKNHNSVAQNLYLQLLYHTNDSRLLSELNAEIYKTESEMKSIMSSNEELSENEKFRYQSNEEYCLFLYKLHAMVMIREEYIDAAYEDLQYLLQHEETHDFAQTKIDELDKKYNNQ
ncbi:MAG: hypothetical protein IJX60_04060, partial [Paludibacteraceae bacterium]|nr:hypothetical protein [Paludibacteraceae bacterium]